MMKRTLLCLALGLTSISAFSSDLLPYSFTDNKYKSPGKAHKIFLEAYPLKTLYTRKRNELLSEAVNKGSVEAAVAYTEVFAQGGYGKDSYYYGIKNINKFPKANDPVLNQRAYLLYARLGDQDNARKYIELEKNRAQPYDLFIEGGSRDNAWMQWDLARYTGNGFFNAPYEPKQVCDEAEANLKQQPNHLTSTFLLGRCYFDGVARPKDEKKGFHLIELAARKLTIADQTLGVIYTTGSKEIPQDLKKAEKLIPWHGLQSIYSLPELPYYYAMYIYLENRSQHQGYDHMKRAADLGNYQAKWLLERQRTSSMPEADLKIFMTSLPQENPNRPKGAPDYPNFDFSQGVIKAEHVLKTANVPGEFIQVAGLNCNSLSRFTQNIIETRKENKLSKTAVLEQAKNLDTYGEYELRKKLIDKLYSIPVDDVKSNKNGLASALYLYPVLLCTEETLAFYGYKMIPKTDAK